MRNLLFFVVAAVIFAGAAYFYYLQKRTLPTVTAVSPTVETLPATQVEAPASGLPAELDQYFRLITEGNYEAAYRTTVSFQRAHAARTAYVRSTFPQAMWPQKLAEAEVEAASGLWDVRRDGTKVMNRDLLPMVNLLRPGAKWVALERRSGGSIFVELSYAESAPDSTTPMVSVTSIKNMVPFGVYTYAPLRRVIVDIMTTDTSAIALWNVVPDSDVWFEWPQPAVVGVELSDGGMRHFGNHPGNVVEPGDPYLQSYDLSAYLFGGRPPYRSVKLTCRDKASGRETFSNSFTSSEEHVLLKLSGQGPYDFSKANLPQICQVTVRDSVEQEAVAEFLLTEAPEAQQGYSQTKSRCWQRKSLDIVNAYTARCVAPAGELTSPLAGPSP